MKQKLFVVIWTILICAGGLHLDAGHDSGRQRPGQHRSNYTRSQGRGRQYGNIVPLRNDHQRRGELLRSSRQTTGLVSLLSEREFQANLRLSSA